MKINHNFGGFLSSLQKNSMQVCFKTSTGCHGKFK